MTTATTKKATSPAAFPAFEAPTLPPEARDAMMAMANMQGEAVKAAMRFQAETVSFLQRRFDKDARLLQDLANSARHGDTYDVLVDFWRQAFADYAGEAGRMAKLESDVARQIAADTRAFSEDVARQTAA